MHLGVGMLNVNMFDSRTEPAVVLFLLLPI